MNRIDIKHLIGKLEEIFTSIGNSEPVVIFGKRYPALKGFIARRFDLHHFRGMSLTWLITGFIINALLVSEFAEEILTTGLLGKIDQQIATYFYSHRNPSTAEYFYYFTQFGSPKFVGIILLIMIVLALIAKRTHAIIALLVSVICSAVTTTTGKIIYHVPRPLALSYYQETSYSFPSGHATVAVAFYGLITYLLIMHVKTNRVALCCFFVGIIFILLLAFSRIYLGVHYLSDVICGLMIGTIWCFLSIALLAWLDFRKDHLKKDEFKSR